MNPLFELFPFFKWGEISSLTRVVVTCHVFLDMKPRLNKIQVLLVPEQHYQMSPGNQQTPATGLQSGLDLFKLANSGAGHN